MDLHSAWKTAVEDWQVAHHELFKAMAAIEWPDPTLDSLGAYGVAYARETKAKERMKAIAEEAVKQRSS
ncbi:hypothetical protein [Achromobacter xylosoxidans]|uniref:hypothetical protein n=1 Tax=Alcaligenes xylosoxydans xylosoxydans TaxID=85698 RepID=UPI000760CC8E|nr:hypothetical protein [Achromobacter xylosoxidans]KWU22268.1 hypothetical protein AS148_06400 [Achromobacter xylosoxidans]